jgi:hypothetical protein
MHPAKIARDLIDLVRGLSEIAIRRRLLALFDKAISSHFGCRTADRRAMSRGKKVELLLIPFASFSVQSSTFSSLRRQLSPKCGPDLPPEYPVRKVFQLKFLPYSCERFSQREGKNDTAA